MIRQTKSQNFYPQIQGTVEEFIAELEKQRNEILKQGYTTVFVDSGFYDEESFCLRASRDFTDEEQAAYEVEKVREEVSHIRCIINDGIPREISRLKLEIEKYETRSDISNIDPIKTQNYKSRVKEAEDARVALEKRRNSLKSAEDRLEKYKAIEHLQGEELIKKYSEI